jgi:hypothetical protein
MESARGSWKLEVPPFGYGGDRECVETPEAAGRACPPANPGQRSHSDREDHPLTAQVLNRPVIWTAGIQRDRLRGILDGLAESSACNPILLLDRLAKTLRGTARKASPNPREPLDISIPMRFVSLMHQAPTRILVDRAGHRPGRRWRGGDNLRTERQGLSNTPGTEQQKG